MYSKTKKPHIFVTMTFRFRNQIQ